MMGLGLYVAQIRVIFTLPEEYGSFKDPLAYVEWFKPLHQMDNIVGMYKVSRSSHLHRRRASIIPVTQIARSCHLLPAFGHSMDRTWTTDNVLESSSSFLLNCYLRHIDFVLLRGVQ